MTTTTKSFSTSLTAALFALAFSAASVLTAVGPAVNVSPDARTVQSYAA